MRISDWSSDVCSSDLLCSGLDRDDLVRAHIARDHEPGMAARAVMPVFLVQPSRIVAEIDVVDPKSEEHRVGKECVSTCRSWWAPYNQKKKQTQTNKTHHNNKDKDKYINIEKRY